MTALAPAIAYFSHAGRRPSNQDAVVAQRLPDGRELTAIADGMGGHAAGEVASARALEVLVQELRRGVDLREAFAAANQVIHEEARQHGERRGMGTTMVALLTSSNGYRVANVGDSRAYRIDGDGIQQITADHSVVAEASRDGGFSADDLANSPWRNALTRAIGTDPTVEVDIFGPFEAEAPHAVLLCSDGLYKSLPDEVIREYVLATPDLETAVRSLAAVAYRLGSDDNITVSALEFGTVPRRSADITLPVPLDLETVLDGKLEPNGRMAGALPDDEPITQWGPKPPGLPWWAVVIGLVAVGLAIWLLIAGLGR